MAGNGQVVGVAAGGERGRELRDAAVLDDLALALAIDNDVVRRTGLVGHLDGQLAGRRRRLVGLDRELAVRVGGDRERAVLGRRRRAAAGLRYSGREQAAVLAGPGHGGRDVGRDVVGVVAGDDLPRHRGRAVRALAARVLGEVRRVEDLVVDDPAHAAALQAVVQRLLEGQVEVGADGALRARPAQHVAGAALLREQLLAGDEVGVAARGVRARAEQGPGARDEDDGGAGAQAGKGESEAHAGANSIRSGGPRALPETGR